MKKSFFCMKGIAALALVFAVGLAACQNPTETIEVTGTTGAPGIAAPAVTAMAFNGGVKLSWPALIDAYAYEVWRSSGSPQVDRPIGSVSSPNADGVYEYFDMVSDSNKLVKDTEYTYTVVAVSSSSTMNNSKWMGKVTITSIPNRGEKLAAPGNVTIELNAEAGTITVNFTAPTTGIIPAAYYVQVTRNGSPVTNDTVSTTNHTFNWSGYNQAEGEYKAIVNGQSGSYFEASDYAVSAGKKHEALFGRNAYLDAGNLDTILGSGATATTITGYTASIYLKYIDAKPDVTYTIQRAPVDANGNTGEYAAVTLSKESYAATAVSAADLAPDILGNMPLSTVFDRTLAATAASYRYRITATKAGQTSYLISDVVEVNPANYISGSIKVGAKTPSDSNYTYTVTPSLHYKNALQTDDKLVLYWVLSTDNYAYEIGPYKNSIVFSKAELEAATIAARTISVSSTGGNHLYVQAYIVLADGTKMNVKTSSYSDFYWDTSNSPGISSVSSYYNNSQIYYAEFDY